MRDLIAINRQLLLLARNESRSPAGKLVTGLPSGILARIGELNLLEIDRLAENINVSLLSFRFDEATLDRLLAIPDAAKMSFALSVVASDRHEESKHKQRSA